MRLIDKLKLAVNVVTGGAAKLTITLKGALHMPGDLIDVRTHVTSTGGEVTSQGRFVDLVARKR